VAIFVAERAGTIGGYVYAAVEPRSWKELRDVAGFIHDIVVDPGARRSGVGRRLIETAVAWLVTRGVPRVVLWTAEQNQEAQRLFEQLGFRRTMIEMTRESPIDP
jgi:ribosomal protein S18 acetylase RimI-like enzyme